MKPRALGWVTLAALVAATSPVVAKPLPKGMKVFLKKGKPFVSKDGVTAQLQDNWNAWEDLKAELSDDGKLLLLPHAECGMDADAFEEMGSEAPSIAMTLVDAKLANAKGMALHVKKKYADAATLFEQAVKLDPATPVFATNWLSALVMGGQVDAANKLLEGGLGKDQIAWYAWRLGVDPELAKLKDQPGAKKFRADKPGTLTSKKLTVAVSPLGVAAVETTDNFGSFVSFVQLSSGTETLRLPMKQKKAIDQILASMAFVNKAPLKWGDEADAKLLEKYEGDAKGAADLGTHVLYIYRGAGCDVSEIDFHATTLAK